MSTKALQNPRQERDQKGINQPSADNERLYLRKRRIRYLHRRFRKINIEKVVRYGHKTYDRWHNRIRRYLTSHPTRKRYPVFVLGSNRSGTQMVNRAIGNSIHGWDYPESNPWAFNLFYLRSEWIIKQLIKLSPAPIVSFGSINDSQFANDLLSIYENAKVVWVYRRYQDAANSSVHRFGGHHKEFARWVANGDIDRLGARGKNLNKDTRQLFEVLFHEGLTSEEGACLYWYMRNQLYFDLNLDQNSRVHIVQYEAAVQIQEQEFRKIFEFLGFPYDAAITDGIFASSVGKMPWSKIDPRIREVCDALQSRLDESCARQGEIMYGVDDLIQNPHQYPLIKQHIPDLS